MRQKLLACCTLSAMVAFEHQALGVAGRQDVLQHVAQARARLRRQFDQHKPGVRPASAMRLAASCVTTASTPRTRPSSQACDAAGVRSSASPSRSTAACGDGTAAHPVSIERGRGTSRSTAAVMMPSVPSAPRRCSSVVAGVVLLQLVEVVQYAPVGQHDFQPQRMRASDAVRDRRRAAGIGREIAADGAGAFRRQQLRVEPSARRQPRGRAAG